MQMTISGRRATIDERQLRNQQLIPAAVSERERTSSTTDSTQNPFQKAVLHELAAESCRHLKPRSGAWCDSDTSAWSRACVGIDYLIADKKGGDIGKSRGL